MRFNASLVSSMLLSDLLHKNNPCGTCEMPEICPTSAFNFEDKESPRTMIADLFDSSWFSFKYFWK